MKNISINQLKNNIMKTRPILLSFASVIFCSIISLNVLPAKIHETNIDSTADAKLETLFNNYWEQWSYLHPLAATFNGDNRFNDRLPNDQTHAYRDTLNAFARSYYDSVKAIDRSALTGKDKVSYDIFLYNMKMELKGDSLNFWMIPFDQFSGMPLLMPVAGAGNGIQPFKTVKDYENWLQRINDFTVWTDSAIGNFRQGMVAGVVLPKVLVEKMIPQMESMVVTDPTKSIFYKPVINFPKEFSEADKQNLTAAYKEAILQQIVPTYKKIANFLKNEYLPKARTTSGIGAVPGGREMYDYSVQKYTTTTETPEQIYQTGLDGVERVTHLIDSVKTSIGFKGDLNALFTYIKTDKRFFPFTTPKQVLDSFKAIHQKIMPNVKKLYGHFPTTAFEIRQVEAFREKSQGVASYMSGAPDGSRPGVFYVPIPDARKFNATDMENTFLHEAIPGHHFQLSLQKEDTSLPKFRRFGGYSAFMEGYALYCESLGKELGAYADPYQYLGALQWDLHRYIRLVLDVGIHAKGMTREQAIRYMMDHEPLDEHTATAEVERYMAWPGQALSYKIGELKILAQRDKYEKELGNKFNLSDFHDELLSGGAMPLQILEERMDAWAAKQAAAGN